MIGLALLSAVALVLPVQDEAEDELAGLSEAQFHQAFEAAFEEVDTETAERLVELNPNRFNSLFNRHASLWITRSGEPSFEQSEALEKARALAEAVYVVRDASGLIEVVESIETWSEEERARFLEAARKTSEGTALLGRFQPREAMRLTRSALETMRELGWLGGVGQCTNVLGTCQVRLGEYETAVEFFEQSMEAHEHIGDLESVAGVLSNLGICATALGRLPRARVHLARSVEILEELGDSYGLAIALGALGSCLKTLGEYPEALECYEKSLVLADRVNDPSATAVVLNNLGSYYYERGQAEKASEYYERSLSIAVGLGDRRGLIVILNNLGMIAAVRGHYREAIEFHRRGLAQAEEYGVASFIVNTLAYLAERYSDTDQEQAIALLERALTLADEVEDPQVMAGLMTVLGSCYHTLGDFQRALDYHRRAFAIDEEVGNPRAVARSLANLGNTLGRLGQYEASIDRYESSLALRESFRDPTSLSHCLHGLGVAYDGLGQHRRAIEHFARALALREEVGNPQLIAHSLNSLGACHLSLGEYAEAIGFLERALTLKKRLGRDQDTATTRINLGRCHGLIGDHETSFRYYTDACRDLGRIPVRQLLGTTRGAFRSSWGHVPSLLSQAALHLGEEERGTAFSLIESLRGQGLLEGLQEQGAKELATSNPELQEERQELLDVLEIQRAELGAALAAQSEDVERVAALREEIGEAEEALERLELRLRLENPQLAELESPTPASLQEVRDHVIPEDTVLLRYVLSDRGSFVWVVTDQDLHVAEIPDEVTIAGVVSELRDAVSNPRRRDLKFVDPARQLYRMLLEPIAEQVAGRAHLLIVPDGVLGLLPFEMLLTKDTTPEESGRLAELPYLLREKTIRYAPSASFPVFLVRTEADREASPSHEKDFLLVADPVYRREGFPRIEKTRDEVLDIARRLVGETDTRALLALARPDRSAVIEAARFDVLLGEAASESRVKGDLTGYRILHFAVHGSYDTESPWLSGLLLSESDPSGFLDPLEIARLNLDADLTFLSACDTAQGELTRSEGVLNTARSFLLAGSRSVVMTHWQVMEQVAPVVAEEFYDRFLAGGHPAEALREAKLALIRERDAERGLTRIGASEDAEAPRWAHPSAWAAFVLFGR